MWAKRQARCLRHVTKVARKAGENIYFGTLSLFGLNLLPEQLRGMMSALNKLIRPLGRWRWYLEATWEDQVHAHFVVISPETICDDQIRRFSTDALGDYFVANASSISFERVKSIRAVSRYVTGYVGKKENSPLFKAHLGCATCGGSKNFFGEKMDVLYQKLSRCDHAWSLMLHDEYILDHPAWDHYFEISDAAYRTRSSKLVRRSDLYFLDGFEQPLSGPAQPLPSADGSFIQSSRLIKVAPLAQRQPGHMVRKQPLRDQIPGDQQVPTPKIWPPISPRAPT